MDTRKLAAICMTSTADKEKNVREALRLVKEAAEAGADWVLLPEMFSYMGPYDRLYELAEEQNGPLFQTLAELSRSLGITLFAGSTAERPVPADVALYPIEQKRVFNTLYVFDKSGSLLGKYRKTHLFHLEDKSQNLYYSEKDGFFPGNALLSFEHEGWRIGCAICYDLRFPELFSHLSQSQALDVVVLPAAFTKATGQHHWQLLLTARAVEQQCYVFSANQTGTHGPGKESFGHSLIIDPWGKVLADTGDKPGIAYATIEKDVIASYRRKLPAVANRRPQLYSPER